MSLFYCLNFEWNYGVLKSKGPLLVAEQKVNFSKNETESKKKKKKEKKSHDTCDSAHLRIVN